MFMNWWGCLQVSTEVVVNARSDSRYVLKKAESSSLLVYKTSETTALHP